MAPWARVLLLLAVVAVGAFGVAWVMARDSDTSDESPRAVLSDGTLQEAVERLERGDTPPPGVDVVDGMVRVEVIPSRTVESAVEATESCNGLVVGVSRATGGISALVPYGCLHALEADDSVEALTPLPPPDLAK